MYKQKRKKEGGKGKKNEAISQNVHLTLVLSQNCSINQSVGHSLGRLRDREIGWLVGFGWLIGRLVDWSVGGSVNWLVGLLVGWLVGRLVGWLVCWLIGQLVGWSVG
jgi:hypothetical protein